MTVRFGPLLLGLPLAAAGAGVAVQFDVMHAVGDGHIDEVAGGEGEGAAALVAGAFGGEEVEGDLAAAGFNEHGSRWEEIGRPRPINLGFQDRGERGIEEKWPQM